MGQKYRCRFFQENIRFEVLRVQKKSFGNYVCLSIAASMLLVLFVVFTVIYSPNEWIYFNQISYVGKFLTYLAELKKKIPNNSKFGSPVKKQNK